MGEKTILVFSYFIKELLPQFISTLTMFCALIIISQMVRMSEVILAFGLSLENIILPFVYIVVPFLTIIIPISFLFAVMISFSRMSMDGELTALFSGGYSVARMLKPVLLLATVLFLVAMASATWLEAWGRREFINFTFRKTQTELDNIIKTKVQPKVFVKDFLGYTLYAEEVSKDKENYSQVMLIPDERSDSDYVIMAPKGRMQGTVESGDLKMYLYNGIATASSPDRTEVTRVRFEETTIDILRVFHERIFGAGSTKDDYRSYNPSQLADYIDRNSEAVGPARDDYLKARYLFHSRFANPFAAVVFGVFGMLLGLQDARRGKSWGYIGAIGAVIFGYVIMNSFKILAEKSYLSAPLAAWLPQGLLFLIALGMAYQRNRLPLSENIFAWQNLPFKRKSKRIS